MDFPPGFNYRLDKTPATLKLLAIVAAIWLLNVGFVAIHEGGHSVTAAVFGATIYNIYISPTGLEGATTHDILPDQTQTNLVLAAGMVATIIALVIAYMIRFELAVYMLGLRTFESLLNFTPGSDMFTLLNSIGSDAYGFTLVMIAITCAIIGKTIGKRIELIRSGMTKTPVPASSV